MASSTVDHSLSSIRTSQWLETALPPSARISLTVSSAAASTISATTTFAPRRARIRAARSEEHTSELQSLMRISYAVFCLKKKTQKKEKKQNNTSKNENKRKNEYTTFDIKYTSITPSRPNIKTV